MPEAAADLIRAQALELRGVTLDHQRVQQLASEVAKLTEALGAMRSRLDFNDEPARFSALLRACAPSGQR